MKEENVKKIFAIILSFSATMGLFLILRVAGVVYFIDTVEEIVEFNVFSALNFINWVGIIISFIVAVLILNYILKTDRFKLNFDMLFSFLMTILIITVIGYNYVGYNFPELFVGLNYFDKIVLTPTWITIFGFFVFDDVFWFWMVTIAIFFGILLLFLLVDMRDPLSAIRKERIKIKLIDTRFLYAVFAIVCIFFIVGLMMVLSKI